MGGDPLLPSHRTSAQITGEEWYAMKASVGEVLQLVKEIHLDTAPLRAMSASQRADLPKLAAWYEGELTSQWKGWQSSLGIAVGAATISGTVVAMLARLLGH